ncbi:MAG: redoxin domain-containing protein, partial [Bacteroidota bacterium]|nr:redoxin domain-containing protein [Bacteroidota bacterium]
AQDSVSGYKPANPVPGSEVMVWYNPSHPKATISPQEAIYASVTFMSDKEFDFKHRQYTLGSDGDRYCARIPIPDDCMKITLYYYTASTNSFDWAGLEIDVYNKSGIPIKDQYPAYAYRNKWFPYPFEFGEDTACMMILEEIKEVEKLRDEDPLGVAYSLAYGYMLAGEEAKSRQEILGMLDKYPGHQLTFQSLTSYSYLVYAGKIDNPEGAAEIDSLHLDMVTKYPDRRIARMYLIGKDTRNVSLELIEQICRNWMNDEPDDAQPYMRLAGRYHDEGHHPKKVIGLAEKGIELLLDPRNRIYLDLKGAMTRIYLSYFSYYTASAWVQLSEFGKALSAAVQANAYMASASNKLLEGQIWMGLGNYSEAEKVLIEAMKLGSGEVEAELRKVYTIYDRSGKSYDDYLAIKLGKDSGKSQQQKKVEQPEVKSNVPSAPDFGVTTMDGKKLSLKNLDGKIIVINFWNLGCGPCRAEMPDLNKLVEKYKDDEVLFIAFSNDQRIRVVEFFKKKEFNYQIVTEANDVFKAYGVKVLPTHVVINSNGTIHHRLTGGGKNIYEILDNMLGTMLR